MCQAWARICSIYILHGTHWLIAGISMPHLVLDFTLIYAVIGFTCEMRAFILTFLHVTVRSMSSRLFLSLSPCHAPSSALAMGRCWYTSIARSSWFLWEFWNGENTEKEELRWVCKGYWAAMGQWGTTASLVSEAQAYCSHFMKRKNFPGTGS